MSYPTLPFALVHFLAAITPERNKLIKGIRHITVIVTNDKSANSRRIEVTDPSQLAGVIQSVSDLMLNQTNDTASIFFSDTENMNVDMGIVLEKGKDPIAVEWTHGPSFLVRLVENPDTTNILLNNVGVQEAQFFLDK